MASITVHISGAGAVYLRVRSRWASHPGEGKGPIQLPGWANQGKPGCPSFGNLIKKGLLPAPGGVAAGALSLRFSGDQLHRGPGSTGLKNPDYYYQGLCFDRNSGGARLAG